MTAALALTRGTFALLVLAAIAVVALVVLFVLARYLPLD